MVVGVNSNRPLGIITKMLLGATRLFYKEGTGISYKGGTSTSYKSGTSVFFIIGTSADYKGRTHVVCSLFFFYLFSHYMYHTQIQNIQIFVILTFTKFFRFSV